MRWSIAVQPAAIARRMLINWIIIPRFMLPSQRMPPVGLSTVMVHGPLSPGDDSFRTRTSRYSSAMVMSNDTSVIGYLSSYCGCVTASDGGTGGTGGTGFLGKGGGICGSQSFSHGIFDTAKSTIESTPIPKNSANTAYCGTGECSVVDHGVSFNTSLNRSG